MDTDDRSSDQLSRRDFIRRSTSVAAAASIGLAAAGPRRSSEVPAGTPPEIIGEGDHRYEVDHEWATLPEGVRFGYTHGVVEDAEGRIYIANQGTHGIVVFDSDGNFLDAWGAEYSSGAHGLNIVTDGGEEVLYLANTSQAEVVKTTLEGEVIWKRGAPDRPDIYSDDQGYSPTETAIAPDGRVYVADGYGQDWIHVYTSDGKYLDSFGGPGDAEDNLSTPHGINIDYRGGRPVVQIADRANVRIVNFDLEGEFVETVVEKDDLRYPCATIHAGGKMYVPDLFARLSIFDENNEKILDLGDYVDGQELTSWDDFGSKYPALENYPNIPHERRLTGKFSSPHDLWVDRDGNIYVVEWIEDGRVTRLSKV